jgi:dihydrofolate reductase
MVGYWPGAEENQEEPPSIRKIAKKMNHLKKYVISATEEKANLEWNNAEQVLLSSDEDIIHFVQDLKSQAGKDIILTGGARLAQSLIRLGQVDEFYFNIYPVVSPGLTWFGQIENDMNLKLLETKTFNDGVVRLHIAKSTANESVGGWDPNTANR